MTCFRDFETPEARAEYDATKPDLLSALEAWYVKVRCIPFAELRDGDLARAIRQFYRMPPLIEVAVSRVVADYNAGDVYDGELLSALSSMEPQEWAQAKDSLKQLKQSIIGKLGQIQEEDADIFKYALTTLAVPRLQ